MQQQEYLAQPMKPSQPSQPSQPVKRFCLVTGLVVDADSDWNNVVDERFEEIAWLAIRHDFAFLNEVDRHVYIDVYILQYIACMYDGIAYNIPEVEQLLSVLPRTVSYWTRESKSSENPLFVPCSERITHQRLFQVQVDYWNYLIEWGKRCKLDVKQNWKLTPLYKRMRLKFTWRTFPFNVPGSPYYNPRRAVPIAFFYHELKHLCVGNEANAAKAAIAEQAAGQAGLVQKVRMPNDYIPTIIRENDVFALNFS